MWKRLGVGKVNPVLGVVQEYAIWTRKDREQITYTVTELGKVPKSGDAGYPSLQWALGLKGIREYLPD